MYLDEVNDQLVPLCDSHMQQVIMHFGEDNIEFYAIDNVKGWLDAVNKRLKFLSERYASILKKLPSKK